MILKKVALYVSLAFLAWPLLHSILIVWDGLHDTLQPADAAVVLGNAVQDDGAPSPRLKSRLDKAAEIYRRGLVRVVIVSGGQGANGYYEAEVMRDYLAGLGLPPENIIADNNGYNTCLTAKNAQRILAENNLSSVILISHYYHLSRAKLAFSKFGIQPVYSAHADLALELRDPCSILREFVGYYLYLLKSCA